MEATIETPGRIGAGAEPIESIDWLRDFDARYQEAWAARDPEAVSACTHEEVVWVDPAAADPLHGRGAVAWFVEASVRAFPDLAFSEPGAPAVAEDARAAYVPWRMTGTNTGPIDPPGFAATGRSVELTGIDVWQFRDGLIWRYEAVYDFAELARQLGLLPPRGGTAESLMASAQRLRSRLRF